MRLVITGMVALLLGVVIGRFGPAQDLIRVRAELAVAQQGYDCESKTLGRDLAALLGGGMAAGEVSQARSEPQDAEESESSREEAKAEAFREEAKQDLRRELGDAGELRTAQTALALRATQARAALIEDADPSDEQLEAIDEAVADMNGSLEVLAQDLVGMFEEGGEPGRRDAMVFAAEALDTMILAEDRIWDALDASQRDEVEDGAVDPFSHVSPGLLDVLSELGQGG